MTKAKIQSGQAKGIVEAVSKAKELLGKEGKIVKAEKPIAGGRLSLRLWSRANT